MSNFEEDNKKIPTTNSEAQHEQEFKCYGNFILCSNCFHDEGLRLDSLKMGIQNNQNCPNCNSSSGYKLTKELVQNLCYRFFVRGTIEKLEYGGFPLIQFNEHNYNQPGIDVSTWLVNDVKLIEQAGEIGLFYYGPRFWMLGEVEPLKSLQNNDSRVQVINDILRLYPVRQLSEKDFFYRVRVDPKIPYDFLEYDTPPDELLGRNRFDTIGSPVLYGSPDLELCIHECRATVEDNLFFSKLYPLQTLKLLDLSALINEDETEFESLDIALHFLFLAGKHSYDICKQIALKAQEQGFDGIIYPSYFSHIRTGTVPFDTVYGISIRRIPKLREFAQSQCIPNIALFGRPVKDKKVAVNCINKIVIQRISYELSFGPAYHKAFVE